MTAELEGNQDSSGLDLPAAEEELEAVDLGAQASSTPEPGEEFPGIGKDSEAVSRMESCWWTGCMGL